MPLSAWVIAGISFLLFGLAPPAQAGSVPDYMERWEFSINIDEDESPRYAADLILPLYRQAEGQWALFLEPRLSVANSEGLYNLGGGYRQLVGDRSWLLGANMFYDYDTTHSHYRIGWGAEAISAYAEARANVYVPISQRRLVEERGSVAVIEEAVHGYDLEFGAPVPYYSRLKVFGGFNWYNFEKFKNRYGWTLRTEYTPVPFLVIDGLVSDDTKGNVDWGMTVAIRIPFGGKAEQIRSPLRWDRRAFSESDVSDQLWRLVERHHEIVVEKYTEVLGSVSVEIRRGT